LSPDLRRLFPDRIIFIPEECLHPEEEVDDCVAAAAAAASASGAAAGLAADHFAGDEDELTRSLSQSLKLPTTAEP